jgi:hypothetical protein
MALFFVRSPVLLVTDEAFDVLYGQRRALVRRVEASLRLFRQVKPVIIAAGAGPDIVAAAVREAGKNPYCVLFPYRYYEGAGRYAHDAAGASRTFILGGRNPDPKVDGAVFIRTDTVTDCFRAGLCAGIIARGQRLEGSEITETAGNDGRVLFFQNETLSAENREAFLAGIREEGFTGEPRYLTFRENYTGDQNSACAVIDTQAASFLDKNLDTPVILFSWIDPDLTATTVKMIFDDSVWALAVGVAKLLGEEHGEGFPGALPSGVVFPSDIPMLQNQRIPGKDTLGRLKLSVERDH